MFLTSDLFLTKSARRLNRLSDAIILALFSNNERGGYFKIGNPQWRRNIINNSDNPQLFFTHTDGNNAVFGEAIEVNGFPITKLVNNSSHDGFYRYIWGHTLPRNGVFTYSIDVFRGDAEARYFSFPFSPNHSATIQHSVHFDMHTGVFARIGTSVLSTNIDVLGANHWRLTVTTTRDTTDFLHLAGFTDLPNSNGSPSSQQDQWHGLGRLQIEAGYGTDYQRITDGTTELQEKFPLWDNSLYTSSTGSTQAVVGDPVGLVNPLAGQGVTTTSPISAERPILRETPEGTRYLEFLSTSRVTFDFGSPFVGAMWVSTLGGSYVVEIDTTSIFVWGQFMPVRNVTGIVFVESYDIESNQAEAVRATLASVTSGQLDWDADRTSFFRFLQFNQVRSVRDDLLASVSTEVDDLFYAFGGSSTLRSLPKRLLPNGSTSSIECRFLFHWASRGDDARLVIPDDFFEGVQFSVAANLFSRNQEVTVPPHLFDHQLTCTSYSSAFVNLTIGLSPQSVENVLVSIAFSANTNGLDNGELGITGDGSPLTPAAENARQQLLARGWDLTLDNIAGL